MVNNSNKTNYPFGGHITLDSAPPDSKCELCEKPAVHRHIVNGGVHHNEAPLLCNPCGAQYSNWVDLAELPILELSATSALN